MAQERAPAGAHERPDGVATAKGDTTEIELSRAEQALARRAAESKATIPHLAVEAEIDMHECAELRARLARGSALAGDARAMPEPGDGAPTSDADETAPGHDDILIKACALALREHPRVNSSYRDGRLQLHSRVNVGLTLWVKSDQSDDSADRSNDSGDQSDDSAGQSNDSGEAHSNASVTPVTPTLFDADLKPLREIARETRALAERARAGSLSPPELSGATFMIASLGARPVESFTGIINPPQAATLTAGAVELRPVVHAGAVVARHTMMVTLACDARVLSGADAAMFLARVRQLLQDPAALEP